jgi:putative DNA primase/helicase
VTADPEDRNRRLFIPSKTNLGRPREGLAYRIADTTIAGCEGELIWAPFVKWEPDPVLMSADEAVAAMAGGIEERSAKEDAKDFLIDVLAEGAVAAKDVKRQAEEAGVSVASLRRAQRSLGVDVHREGGIAAKGRWLWSLSKVPKMSKVLTSEDEHLRHLSEHLSDGEAFQEPVSNASSRSYQEAQFGDGDPFASLKDPSLKFKAEPAREDYPKLPEFLNRRAVS